MATVDLIVGASSDDAHEASTGTVSTNAGTLTVDAAGEYIGLRFNNVTIGQGDSIDAAELTVNVVTTAADSPNVDIHCEDADDAGAFSASSNNISSRARTSAKTTWSATNIGTGDHTQGIAAAVQEVIDRPGWASGNDLVVILVGLSGTDFRINSFDNSTSLCARLDITYTSGGGGSSQPPRSMHQYRLRRE
jgi:hypothetical protein